MTLEVAPPRAVALEYSSTPLCRPRAFYASFVRLPPWRRALWIRSGSLSRFLSRFGPQPYCTYLHESSIHKFQQTSVHPLRNLYALRLERAPQTDVSRCKQRLALVEQKTAKDWRYAKETRPNLRGIRPERKEKYDLYKISVGNSWKCGAKQMIAVSRGQSNRRLLIIVLSFTQKGRYVRKHQLGILWSMM